MKYLGLAVVFMATVLTVFSDFSQSSMVFVGSEVFGGQWWRLFSAHFAHTNWVHAAMNMTTWLILFMLFRPVFRLSTLTGTILISSATISLMYLLLYPEDTLYQGFSGVLHGVLVAGAILCFPLATKLSLGLLVFVVLKLLFENLFGTSPTLAQLIDARIATEAHLAGAISGGCFALALLLKEVLMSKRQWNDH